MLPPLKMEEGAKGHPEYLLRAPPPTLLDRSRLNFCLPSFMGLLNIGSHSQPLEYHFFLGLLENVLRGIYMLTFGLTSISFPCLFSVSWPFKSSLPWQVSDMVQTDHFFMLFLVFIVALSDRSTLIKVIHHNQKSHIVF